MDVGRDEIVQAVLDGTLDNDLDWLAKAVRTRREELEDRRVRELKLSLVPGDRVMFTHRASPKELVGQWATVEGYARGKRIPVRLDQSTRRFSNAVSIKAHLATLERRGE